MPLEKKGTEVGQIFDNDLYFECTVKRDRAIENEKDFFKKTKSKYVVQSFFQTYVVTAKSVEKKVSVTPIGRLEWSYTAISDENGLRFEPEKMTPQWKDGIDPEIKKFWP